MEAAFNKAHKQNQRKIMELVEHEEKLNKVYAEKAKAEQKYFSTMKSRDQLQAENRALKQQLAKTTELISKFQETEKSITQKMVWYVCEVTEPNCLGISGTTALVNRQYTSDVGEKVIRK